MKKIKTRLQLTKTTVRVLQGADLAAVRGGAPAVIPARTSSDDPNACVADAYYGLDGAKKL